MFRALLRARGLLSCVRIIAPLKHPQLPLRLPSLRRSYGSQIGDVNAENEPRMAMQYTCNKCNLRQTATFTRHSYEKGVVIVRCNGCSVLHLVADNLDWFQQSSKNIEEMLRSKGERVRRVGTSIEVLPGNDSGSGSGSDSNCAQT